MQKFPEFSINQSFDDFVALIEKLLNSDSDRLLKIAFDVYDFN